MSTLKIADYRILQAARKIAFERYKKEVLKGLEDNEINNTNTDFYKKIKKCKTFSSIHSMFQGTVFYEGRGEKLLSNMLNSFGIDIDV